MIPSRNSYIKDNQLVSLTSNENPTTHTKPNQICTKITGSNQIKVMTDINMRVANQWNGLVIWPTLIAKINKFKRME